MRVTIRDVAAASGVSIATVSRALAGSPTVAAKTRERVGTAAAELGYVPNQAARELVTGRRQAIALVLPDLQNPFYAAVAKGVQQAARQAGMSALICDTDEEPLAERELVASMADVAGTFILASPRMHSEDLAEFSSSHHVVLINRQAAGGASVIADNASGIRQVVDHLRALGHARIGYAGGPENSWSDARRREALAGAASKLEVVDLGAHIPGIQGGLAAADRAIAAGVSAVISFNDQLALGILGRLSDRGVSVPQHMSVVGFDDVPVAKLLAPALTTVTVPMVAMGRSAAELAVTKEVREEVLEVELTVRGSSAPATNR